MWAPVGEQRLPLRIYPGPLLADFLAGAGGGLDKYFHQGGYQLARQILAAMRPAEVIEKIDASGLRGRGGGGFPTGLKWSQVAHSPHPEKYFVCNAHAGQPGGFKERFLLEANPHRVIEAAIIAAFAVGAKAAILYLGGGLDGAERSLLAALDEAREAALVGPLAGAPDVLIYRSPGGYITGEETAALELIEGRIGRPRGKPPLPTRQGLKGAPTAINNLETVLQAHHVLKLGPERFRATGTLDAPGTLLFCLSGEVEHPGLYELPLGTPLRELVYGHGGGASGGGRIKAVLAGGVGSCFLGPEALDVPLDYDAMRELGADLSSGVVIVVAEGTSSVDLAIELARFYRDSSCGKCQPCGNGTSRVLLMLERLEDLDEKAIDLADRARPPSPRKGLTVLQDGGEPGGVSYTDLAQGLDKIRQLAEWYKYRGDCHHPAEAAGAIQSLLALFADEFEARRRGPAADREEATA
jgi:NADH:ubiquinone oxidoreductase subunit F (NADH-binding)